MLALVFSRFPVKLFWFWADQPPAPRSEIAIEPLDYDSPPFQVRYRGWFVNNEVCLNALSPDRIVNQGYLTRPAIQRLPGAD